MAVAARGDPEDRGANHPPLSVIGDVESQLQQGRPLILRTQVPPSALPKYLDMANRHGYGVSVDWRTARDDAVRVVFSQETAY